MLSAVLEHVHGDWLHGRAAIPAVRASAVDDGVGYEIVDIYSDDALNRIDERDGVTASFPCGYGGSSDIRDIRCELDDHRFCSRLLYPSDNGLKNLGFLTNGRAHA